MAAAYERTSLAFFAADFETTFGRGIPEACERLAKELSPTTKLIQSPPGCVFSWAGEGRTMQLNHHRISWQMLTMQSWREHAGRVQESTSLAASMLKISLFKRIGFKLVAFVPQKMAHEELIDLLFGTVAGPHETWSRIGDTATDPQVLLDGTRNGFKFDLHVTSMSPKQSSENFLSLKHLEGFVQHKLIDHDVRSVHDAVMNCTSNLFVDVDVSRAEMPLAELESFFGKAVETAEEIISSCERVVLSKPSAKGKK